MYILISNNRVISGPRDWSKRIFEAALSEELNITATLPVNKTDDGPIFLTPDVKIMKVVYQELPEYDKRIQVVSGPYFDFSGTLAIGSYQVQDKPISVVKAELKNTLAHNRWVREVSGTTALVQGQEITLSTQRGERDIFAQALLLGADGKTWKFDNNIWLNLSLEDLHVVVNAIATHVSNSFVWESTINSQIDAATELSQLTLIDVTWPTTQNT